MNIGSNRKQTNISPFRNQITWRRSKLRKEKKVELKTNHPLKDINESELVDISTVKINTDLPVKERIKDYIRQIKNPYCYLDHGVVVKISFAGTKTLDECLKAAFMTDTQDPNRTFAED